MDFQRHGSNDAAALRKLWRHWRLGLFLVGLMLEVLLVAVVLWGVPSLRAGCLGALEHFFSPEKTQIRDDFFTYVEKTVQVNKLVLLERHSREEVSRRINKTYALPGLEQYGSISGSATVAIRCPVTMTYYVDLQEPWQFQLRDGWLTVHAPPIRIAPPNIGIGQIERRVESGWLVFGENEYLHQLEKELQLELWSAAMRPENLAHYRNECRQALEKFLLTWVIGSQYRINGITIIFSGEHDQSATAIPAAEPEATAE